MLRVVLSLLLLLALPVSAVAQTDGPVMGSSAGESPPAETQSEVRQILVIGDVLGGGLGAGMTRLTEASGEGEVTLRFVEESGIARPEVYDWGATLPKIFESNSYDSVVVLLGSNDRQMIKDGNLRYVFGTPEWADAYGKRTDRILDILAKSGAAIYWVSLPPMGEAEFEAAMQQVMAIQKERVAARGFAFVDIRKPFLDANGAYTDTGPDDTGTVRRLRSSDGITFFKQGNNRLAQLVLAALKDAKPAAKTVETVEAVKQDSVRALPPQVPDIALPTFGQWDADGNPLLVTPRDVVVAMASATSDNFSVGAGTLADLLRSAQPGSSSERLFRRGEAASAPAGRLDDFSLPPPPTE